jgi:hypothetical protein
MSLNLLLVINMIIGISNLFTAMLKTLHAFLVSEHHNRLRIILIYISCLAIANLPFSLEPIISMVELSFIVGTMQKYPVSMTCYGYEIAVKK